VATAPAKAKARSDRSQAGDRTRALEERIAGLEREQNDLRQALFGAAQLQRKLCATRDLRRGRFEIASELFPVRHISGDFYNVMDLGAQLGLAVGDIAGKGMIAGLWFSHLVGLVRMHAESLGEPDGVARAINRHLCAMQPEPPMAAMFLARLDVESGELIYSNAALPPAVVLRRGGTVESLGEGGPLLGAFADSEFSRARVNLGPGDTLVAFSDGVVECRNSGDEEFGLDRLLAAARSATPASSAKILFSILGAVQDFAGSRPREDDFAVMVVRGLDGSGRKHAAPHGR
jgi:sigma-B regulation protein RsbU (phosphoserine phosphatase)